MASFVRIIFHPLLLSFQKHGVVSTHIERIFVTNPVLVMSDFLKRYEITLHELGNLGQCFELVYTGEMQIAVEMGIILLLIFNATT